MLLAPSCKKGEGGACFEPSECAEGLACVGDGLMRCEKCKDLTQCTDDGLCTAKDAACVATSDADCKASYGCKARGPCSAKNGVCVVGSDADCEQSEACAKQKYCVAQGNNCIMSDANKQAASKAQAEKLAAATLKQKKQDAEDAMQ